MVVSLKYHLTVLLKIKFGHAPNYFAQNRYTDNKSNLYQPLSHEQYFLKHYFFISVDVSWIKLIGHFDIYHYVSYQYVSGYHKLFFVRKKKTLTISIHFRLVYSWTRQSSLCHISTSSKSNLLSNQAHNS